MDKETASLFAADVTPSTRKTPKARARAAKATPKIDTDVADIIAAQGLVGGTPRQTLPINANVLGMIPWMFIPRRQYQDMDLTTITPGSFSPQQLMDLLADAWPDMSLALWNFLRLCAGKWHYEVRSPDNEEEDTDGKAVLDAILKKVNKTWGGIDNLLTQWVMSVVLEGACAGECVPNEAIDDVDDFITVQPWTIYFQRDITQKYVAFQWQPMLSAGNAFIVNPSSPAPSTNVLLQQNALNHGGFRMLNEVTFCYVPLDPAIDDPYGRMAMASVMQLIAFDAQLLKDLRQWSHVNAFGRINVSVVAELVKAMMPPAVANDKNERIKFFNAYLASVQQAYNQINADDTFIHYDNVTVTGIDASGKTFEIDNLIRILERRIFRALKQLPILMGSNEGTTETHGSVQFEIYVRGIQSIQRVVASLMERMLNVALRIHGRNSVVTFEFDSISAADRQKEAIAESIEIKNAAAKRDQGWITQDEASILVTGSAAVAKGPNPDPAVAPLEPDAGGDFTAAQTEAPAPPAATPPASKPDPDAAPDVDEQADPDADEDAEAIQAAQKKADSPGNGRMAQRRAARLRRHMFNATRAVLYPDGIPEYLPNESAEMGTVYPYGIQGTDTDNRAEPPIVHTGVMAAFMLPPTLGQHLALPDGLPVSELHCTLAFMGEASEYTEALSAQHQTALRGIANTTSTLTGRVAGFGRFTDVPKGEPTPIYASLDVPGLNGFRERVADALGEKVSQQHGFTPHVTLAYIRANDPMPELTLPDDCTVSLDTLTLAVGIAHYHFPLLSSEGTEPRLSPSERTTITQAMAATRATAPYAHRSAARVAFTRKVQGRFADYFAQQRISRGVVEHLLSAHTPKTKAGKVNKRALTGNARETLRKNLISGLQAEIPDYDPDLNDLLNDTWDEGYDLAGQEALAAIDAPGTFRLNNPDILAAIALYLSTDLVGIQQTTRDRVATVLIDGIEGQRDTETVMHNLDGLFTEMGDARAENIATTETATIFGKAQVETWGRNGVEYKVWRTTVDPDPQAGATGETPCRDNAYAGAIPITDSFPSGDDAPPAHNRCECDLEPSGGPSDSASTDPWTGD